MVPTNGVPVTLIPGVLAAPATEKVLAALKVLAAAIAAAPRVL